MAYETLAGSLRSILGQLTVEQTIQDRDTFRDKVQDSAETDLMKMGFEVVNFVIQEIRDEEGYLAALGRKRTAEVIRDAEIGEATAQRASREEVARASRAAQEAELIAEIAIAEATKDKDVQVAQFRRTADSEKATADMAYALQEAEVKKDLASREGEVLVEKARQEAAAATERIDVAKQEQQAEVVVPADAEREATVIQAQASGQQTEIRAEAEAKARRLKAEADAAAERAEGEGEADANKARGLAGAAVQEAQGNAAAAAEKAGLLATAEGTRAQLEAQAVGERELADARAAQDEINLRQHVIDRVIDGRVEMTQAFAEAMANFGADWKIVQFAGGDGTNGNGSTPFGNLRQIPDLMAQVDEQVRALTGKGLKEQMDEISSIIRGGDTKDSGGDEEADTPQDEDEGR